MADIKTHDEVAKEGLDLNRFFYLSFRYSQGSPKVQNNFFEWASKKKIFTNFPKELPMGLKVWELPKKHISISENRVNNEFKLEWTRMVSVFSDKEYEVANLSDIISSMTKGIIEKETRYLKDDAGRPTTKEMQNDYLQQPHYKSYLRDHAILDKPTGHPIFDDIFKEIKKEIFELKKSSNSDLLYLESLYETRNPGIKFFPEIQQSNG